jgi:hypothetical protein
VELDEIERAAAGIRSSVGVTAWSDEVGALAIYVQELADLVRKLAAQAQEEV